MHPQAIEEMYHRTAGLYREQKHPEALQLLDELDRVLPNSPMLVYYRAQNLAALGRTKEALAECNRFLRRLEAIRSACNALDELLDPAESEQLAEVVAVQTGQIGSLKATLDARQAEGLDKLELQGTVEKLQRELAALQGQAG